MRLIYILLLCVVVSGCESPNDVLTEMVKPIKIEALSKDPCYVLLMDADGRTLTMNSDWAAAEAMCASKKAGEYIGSDD